MFGSVNKSIDEIILEHKECQNLGTINTKMMHVLYYKSINMHQIDSKGMIWILG